MSEIEKFDAGDTVRVCFTSIVDSDGFIFTSDSDGDWVYFNYDSLVEYGVHQDITAKVIKKSPISIGYYPVIYKNRYDVFYWDGESWFKDNSTRDSEFTTQVGPRIAN